MKRMPAVSGQFYSSNPAKLTAMLKDLAPEHKPAATRAIGIVSPHAGLIYSGKVAGAVYAGIEPPDTYILLGPNHTGVGKNISLMSQGEWEIPTGTIQIDELLAEKILAGSSLISDDEKAHLYEHSLEVQLPFIAYYSKNARIVPITVLHASLDDLKALGHAVASAINATAATASVLMVASSDMSHYLPEEVARKQDRLAINQMLALEADGLYETVREHDITMCGYMPTVAMLSAANELGAEEATLVKYTTSGEVSGDFDNVVGYASIMIT